jgi:prepilin-type N-terminal cleavage/methylation domain-containing protein
MNHFVCRSIRSKPFDRFAKRGFYLLDNAGMSLVEVMITVIVLG